MDKVVAADGGGVAVPHDHNDLQFRVGELDPGSEGQGPAVGGVQGVEVHVYGEPPGAADAGDEDDVVLGEAGAVNGPDQRAQDNAVAAPRAPDMGELFSWRRYLWMSLVTSAIFRFPRSAFRLEGWARPTNQ